MRADLAAIAHLLPISQTLPSSGPPGHLPPSGEGFLRSPHRQHRHRYVILLGPGAAGGGVSYGLGGLLRRMAQFGAELQLLHQPVAPVGQRTVADQHDPVPGVQRSPKGEGFLFYKLFIYFTLTERCPGGGLFGGGGGGQTARLQGAGGGDGFFQGRRGGLLDGGRVGTGQNQHILAAGVVVLIKGHGLAEGRLFDLLMQLGPVEPDRRQPKAAERFGPDYL